MLREAGGGGGGGGRVRVTLAKNQGMDIFFETIVIKLSFIYQNTLAAGLHHVG